MFSYACGSGAVLQLLCTAVVGQVCSAAVGLNFCVVFSSCGVVRSSLGLTEIVRGYQKVSRNYCQEKRLFSTTATKGLIDKTRMFYSPYCDTIPFQRLQVPGQRRPEEGGVSVDTSAQRRGAVRST